MRPATTSPFPAREGGRGVRSPLAGKGAGGLGAIFRAAAFALGLAAAIWTQAGLGIWLAVLLAGWRLAGQLALRLKPPLGTAKPPEAGCGGGGQGGFWAGWAGGLVLAMLGLLPAVIRHGWGSVTYVLFGDHFVYPHQLLWPGWGRGPSISGPDDTLSFSLGLVAFGLVVTALAWPQRGGEREGIRSRALGYLLPGLFLAFMASSLAAAVWGLLSVAARTLTYPWQLLLLAGPWWVSAATVGAQKLAAALPRRAGQGQGRAILPSAALVVLIVLSAYGDLRVEPAGAQPPPVPTAIFGQDEIVLLQAITSGVPGPGGRVTVAVEWQALRPLDRDYTVFFHVIGPDGMRYGQQDTMPLAGRLPTSRWRPGQVVFDEYSVALASDVPVGAGYRYWLGFYDLTTGERLAVAADDKVVLEPGGQ